MITRTIERNGVTATVTRETRWSILQRAFYRNALQRLYPTWAQFEKDNTGKKDDEGNYISLWDLADAHPEGDFYKRIMSFLGSAPYVSKAEGFPFRWPKIGEMPTDDHILTMFEHYMMEDAGGSWSAVEQAVLDLSQQLTPPEQQPYDMLTEEQKKDANLSQPGGDTSGTSKKVSRKASAVGS